MKSCLITLNDCTFLIDLVCLPSKRIDVVLGMDWISFNSVDIGYLEKTISMFAYATTLEEGISKLLEGSVSEIYCLFEQNKTFLQILNAYASGGKRSIPSH